MQNLRGAASRYPELTAAVTYLSRDPHVNRELLLALLYDPLATVKVARRHGSVVGVLIQGTGPLGAQLNWVRIDADDEAAVAELVTADLLHSSPLVSVHRAWIAALLGALHGLVPTGDGVYGYVVDQSRLQLRHDPAVRQLEPADAKLVERSSCGWSRAYFARLFEEQRHPWAAVKDGAIICRASTGYPAGESEEVIGVWTHPGWRGRGLAQAVVAAVAADILERVPYAAYTTTYTNHASQAVARAVGFRECFAAVSLQRGEHTHRG